MMVIMGVVLMALPTMAQTFGTKYAEKPSVVFQSTSTMMGSGSTYSANPTINTDGTAYYNGAAASGPRRVKMDDPVTPPNPETDDDDKDNTPLGDAVLPLLLCALAFCGVVYLRRKRSALSR